VIYAAVGLLWIGFAKWIAPDIIAAAYHERGLSVLNWAFQGHRSLPIEHYLDRWSMMAAAVQIAMSLHLMIVLFIRRTEYKYRIVLHKTLGADLRTNFVLNVFSAAFLALTVLSWIRGDYRDYLDEWVTVLAGRIPWLNPLNAYGPLFNVLAPLVWVNPLANKLLFAFSYLVYVVWLIKDFAPRRGLVGFPWPWLVFWLLNPFPWVEIAYFGYFDVLVALACVAAVHNLIGSKDGTSGTYLAFGILLKYMPIVILPFLALSERRIHFRLLSFCFAVIIFSFVVSVLIWGTSTFLPLTFAATRDPDWSIYDVLASSQSPRGLDWLEKPLLVIAGLGIFAWCMRRRTEPAVSAALAVLVTLLFYRLGYINYQMVLFVLISYWVVAEWRQFEKYSALIALLAGYFALLAIMELVHWSDMIDIAYTPTVMCKTLLGCGLLIVLVQFSARAAIIERDAKSAGPGPTKHASQARR
jgi:hypothetical protein